jgi:hypothetical protein
MHLEIYPIFLDFSVWILWEFIHFPIAVFTVVELLAVGGVKLPYFFHVSCVSDFVFSHLRLSCWLEVLITCSLSVISQDQVVAGLKSSFSPWDWGYSSTANHLPTSSGHWVWSPAQLRRKLAGVSWSSYCTDWHCMWAEGRGQSRVSWVLGAASVYKKLCSLWARQVPICPTGP